ncbi:MAG: Uma2 family endonuclease [Chloroflexota bacterium]|nr:Uma2 family endonuclease [Chloroflexota bacterium]
MGVATRLTSMDPVAPMRWTLEDYHRAIDAGLFDDRHVELVDGEIYEMPPMRDPHIGAAMHLERAFAPLLASNQLRIDKPIILPQDGEPEPDIAVVREGAPLKPYVDDVLLAIEVSHATRRFDRGLKLEAYLRDSLRELWIVDIAVRELLVYRDGELTATFRPGQGRRITGVQVPDITVDVDALFAAAGPAEG